MKSIIHIKKEIDSLFDENCEYLDLHLEVFSKDVEVANCEIEMAYNDWMFNNCDGIAVINHTSDDLMAMTVSEYILLWLENANIFFTIQY